MNLRKSLLAAALLVGSVAALFMAVQSPASAQNQTSLEGVGIAPAKMDIVAEPGANLKRRIKIINPSQEEMDFKLYVSDFKVIDEGYTKEFVPAVGKPSPVDWFKLPAQLPTLPADTTVDVDIEIQVPEDAAARSYQSVIFAETLEPEVAPNGVASIKRVGSLVFMTVKGDNTEAGKFLDLDLGWLQLDNKFKAGVRVENTGNVHFDVTGQVRVLDLLGRTVSSADMHNKVIDGTIRRFDTELGTPIPFGIYVVKGEVQFLDQKVELGPRWIFVASPFWIAIMAVVLLGLIGLIGRMVKKRRGKRVRF